MIEDFLLFLAVGFAAQMIDGALGMAYGISATTVLLSLGTPPAVASASVHVAEVFTTGASGFAHWRLGNVDKRLLVRLAIPGMIGGALGAYVLSSFPGEDLAPFVSGYLFIMGAVILIKAWRLSKSHGEIPLKRVPYLGFVGAFLDAAGGGGWGPIVASNLIGSGAKPRMVIGSVNLAEFFVTAVISATFIVSIGLELWLVIAGLVVGGVIAAPIAARLAKSVPDKPLMLIVGVVVMLLSLRGLVSAFG